MFKKFSFVLLSSLLFLISHTVVASNPSATITFTAKIVQGSCLTNGNNEISCFNQKTRKMEQVDLKELMEKGKVENGQLYAHVENALNSDKSKIIVMEYN